MTTFRLLTRSLLHYWRTNLAVLLGVIAGTAVIGGALVVGDSVRMSLQQMSLRRLGWIDHVLHSHRFFREELADVISRQASFQERFESVAPVLMMTGSLEYEQDGGTRRASKLNVFGVDERLWKLTEHGSVELPEDGEVVLSHRVAGQLEVQPGDEMTLWVALPSSIPRDSLLGERKEMSREIALTVKAVLDETSGLGRLALNPNQQLPANVFVALNALQSNLDLAEVKPSRRHPTAKPARANSLFVAAKSELDQAGKTAPAAARALTELVSQNLTPADLSLRIEPNTERGYLSLESEQLILEEELAGAAETAAKKLGLARSPVLVYLANEIANADDTDAFSMYSIIAGLDFPDSAPFGPFQFVGEPLPERLGPGGIVLNDWLARDLQAGVGDKVTVKYHVVGSHGELPEKTREFKVRGIVKVAGPAADRGLTPEVEGITDAEKFDDWEQPFPMQLNRVTGRDEEYWDRYRATPKAFVSLSTAQDLWSSRYGRLTSVRIAPLPNGSLEETARDFTRGFFSALDPGETGLVFQPVKSDGLKAASGTTDFSGLFFGFSFFLILAATILIGLLFRLGLERRGTSVGLLSAVGFAPAQIRRLFLAEGLLVVCAGGLLGTLAAVGYASLMVYGLKTWWIDAIGTTFLFVYVEPASLATGFGISVVITSLAVWWSLRQLRGLSPRELLSGVTERALSEAEQRRRGRGSARVGTVGILLAVVLTAGALSGLIPAQEAFSGLSWQVVAFFITGMALLVASLSFLSAWLDSDRSAAVRGAGVAGMSRLGMRNASRHRQRSVFTVGLIASATFVIVAVAAGHRNPAVEIPVKDSGNGGFLLVAESSQPILYDLNTPEGRDKLDLNIEEGSSQARLLEKAQVMPFRVQPGEQASCLNLYQTKLPTVLGVPQQMIDRGGFKFADTKGDNPWTLLNETREDGSIPVLGDMNTLMYSLHKGIGDTIAVPDEKNPQYTLSIAGMLDGSVFQGVLLMSEANFHRLYPDREGFQYFLIGDRRDEDRAMTLSGGETTELSNLLETGLTPYGFDAERVVDRLADFLAVQNTYLSTFQTLGGLGLLLGTLGLGTVMLRNVLERRVELALLRAVGFRNASIAWLVLWENAFLLLWGLAAGTVSALAAMMPHLLTISADVPWSALGLMLAGVFLIGMCGALLAVSEAVRTPILSTLRAE